MDAEAKHDAEAVEAAFRGHPDTWTAKGVLADEVRSLQAQLAAERETFTPPGGSPLSRPTAWAWYTANIALGKLHDSDRAQKKEITDLRTRLSEAEAEKQLREAAEANLAHWVKEHGIETEKRGETERELDDAVARAGKAESESAALRAELEQAKNSPHFCDLALMERAEKAEAALASAKAELEKERKGKCDWHLPSCHVYAQTQEQRDKDRIARAEAKLAEAEVAALKQESERMREALRRILTLQVRVAGGLTSSAAIADAVLFAGEALSPAPNPQEQK